MRKFGDLNFSPFENVVNVFITGPWPKLVDFICLMNQCPTEFAIFQLAEVFKLIFKKEKKIKNIKQYGGGF